MPHLPIDVLEIVVDCSADYPKLLSSLSLVSRMLTPRTRVNMFHAIHLNTPNGPNADKPGDRYEKGTPTRCDAFLTLCLENPDIPLYVRLLTVTESIWHPTTGDMWTGRSASLVPVVRSLHNLTAFSYRTEGIMASNEVLCEVVSLVLRRPKMDWIHLSDLSFFLAGPSAIFHVFADAAPPRILSLADLAVSTKEQGIPDLPGYTPLRIDTLAISFDCRGHMEEPFIRNVLRGTCPLLDVEHIRCLQLRVYHTAEDMDRVHAWLSMLSSLEELDIRIVRENKALDWRNRNKRYRRPPIIKHFVCSEGLHMSCLRSVKFRVGDHDGVWKIAAVLQFIALVQSLTQVTIHFVSARGPLAFLDEEAWKQVDDTLARAPTFPLLDRVDILFEKNSHILPDVEENIKAMMINTAHILTVTVSP
ncbi:hypothetical protein DFH06DRAFT_1297950 [Mycena polygramma]|nr:hypothetical protein DFH06DRAFT_1297950 [Mycena polygramma]